MNIAPIKYRVERVLKGGRSYGFSDVCEKSWTLCPAPNTDRVLPPAIALEGQFDRVTGLSHAKKTFKRERELLAGTWKEHRVTTAYLLKDVSFLNGYGYAGPAKLTLVSEPETWFGLGETEHFSKAALGCTHTGNTWYSHWMTDNLTLELAARDLAQPIILDHKPYSHAAPYRQQFGLDAPTVRQVHCDELIIIDDVSQNSYKQERYNYLRDRLKSLKGERTGHGVMILRGRSGQLRLLKNEPEVEKYLSERGFTIVDPQNMSVEEIIRKIQGAKIVVGVEGSTMAHGFFSLADEGTICILQPPFRFNALYKEYADCVGMRFAYVVGTEDSEGFTIDLDELGHTLDLIERTT